MARGWDWNRLESLRYGPSIAGWYLFPTADVQEAMSSDWMTVVFPGHALLTAWIGLALAWACRQAGGGRAPRWQWPVLVGVVVLASHGFFNATSGGELNGVANLLQFVLTARGHVLLWGFWPALALAVVIDRRALASMPGSSTLPVRLRRWMGYRSAMTTPPAR